MTAPTPLVEAFRSTLARIHADFGAIEEHAREARDAIETELQKADAAAMAFLDGLKTHLLRNPEPVFAILRQIKPILIVKNYAIVTRFADVQEVLARDNIFQVTYGEKMRVITGGNDFFLGMQDSPAYARDVSNMRIVFRRDDIPGRVVPFVDSQASSLVEAANGALDVVKLSKTVPARWVADYFGCPLTTEEELAQWGSVIFQYLFTDLANDPAVGHAAGDAAAKARAWLDRTIAARKANPGSGDDVLGRCLAMQRAQVPGMDDLSIRNNLIGLLTGAIPTTSKCCAQALDQLLERPDALKGAQDAALANDDALLAKYVFEALRFNPNNPGIFRICAEDYTVAKGSLRETTIPKGTTVLPATQSAMFDGQVVDRPDEFRIDRPPYLDMHFGYGMHTCFGQYVNRVQIPGILKPLLQRPNLRRAGALEYQGPFPSSLAVRFD